MNKNIFTIVIALLVPTSQAAAQSLTGAWDWENRLTTKDGNIRTEKEAWLLVEDNGTIRGQYRRSVTVLSVDGKPFACNGLVKYTRVATYKVSGTVKGHRVHIKEVSVQVQPGPCDDGQRRLDSYEGTVRADTLSVRWSGGTEILKRRDMTGLWMGSTEKTLAQGDKAQWMETWRLVQRGQQIAGLRDRTDVRISGNGQSYRCSHGLRIIRSIRWPLTGRIVGTRMVIKLSTPLVRRSPCERRVLKPGTLILEMGYDRDMIRLSGPEASLVLTRQDKLDPGLPGLSTPQTVKTRAMAMQRHAKTKVGGNRDFE